MKLFIYFLPSFGKRKGESFNLRGFLEQFEGLPREEMQ